VINLSCDPHDFAFLGIVIAIEAELPLLPVGPLP
jgi:hypothetical protein